MEYKGLNYDIHPEYSAVSILSNRQWDDGGVEAIVQATKFTELLGHLKVENVIVDERQSSRPPAYFVDFLQNRLFKDSISYGVKRIFYILNEDDRQFAIKAFSNKPEYVYLCTSLDEVIGIIAKAEGNNS